MKKYLLILSLSVFCISCADLNTQMAGLKKALNGDESQGSSPTTSGSTSSDSSKQVNQKKTVNTQNAESTNKQSSTTQSSTLVSKNDRVTVDNSWVSKMKQDTENSKSPQQKEYETNRQGYKELASQADSIYRCIPPLYSGSVTILILKNNVKFYKLSGEDISKLYTDVQVKNNLVYFTQNDDVPGQSIKYKNVLDTSNNKMIQMLDSTNPMMGNTKNASEAVCRKLK